MDTHPLIKNKKNIKADTFPKYDKTKIHPLVANLPDYLKDHANYKKIQRVLLDTLATGHSHDEVEKWAKCFKCMKAVENHKMAMKNLGFNSPAQYYAWRRIHNTIDSSDRLSLPKYNESRKSN